MELAQYLSAARRWWWLLIMALVVGGGAAYYLTSQQSTTYTAKTRLLVLQQTTPGVSQIADLTTSERLAFTFADLVTLRSVMEQAISDGGFSLTPKELERALDVANPPSTMFLEVRATAGSVEQAVSYANVVAQTFVDSDAVIVAQDAGVVRIVEDAVDAEAHVPPTTLNAVLGAIVAFGAAVTTILVIESLDRRVRGSVDVFTRTGLPTVGQIERVRGRRGLPSLHVVSDQSSPIVEDFRTLRTNLSARVDLDREGTALLIASPTGGDGKSTVAANLAVVFGLAGRKVLLVDADLRNPKQHEIFGVDNDAGLTTALTLSNADVEATIQQTSEPNVSLLSAGPMVTNPSELLGSLRMHLVMEVLKSNYDLVMFDSPPLLSVTDAAVLAGVASGSVLVLRSNKTDGEELVAAAEALAQSGTPIHGVVLNEVADSAPRHFYGARNERLPRDARWRNRDEPRVLDDQMMPGDRTGS